MDDSRQGLGSQDGSPQTCLTDCTCDGGGAGLVGILCEHFGEVHLRHRSHQGGSRPPTKWVHAQIQRTINFKGKASLGIVELHGRDAEVGENDVHAGHILGGEELRQAGEIRAAHNQRFRRNVGGAQACLGFWEFNWIHVQAVKASIRQKCTENFQGMAAVAQGGIHGDFTGFGSKHSEDFADTNRAMAACGSLAARDDLLDVRGVAIRVVFLVFVGEAARVRPTITNPALVGWGRSWV